MYLHHKLVCPYRSVPYLTVTNGFNEEVLGMVDARETKRKEQQGKNAGFGIWLDQSKQKTTVISINYIFIIVFLSYHEAK